MRCRERLLDARKQGLNRAKSIHCGSIRERFLVSMYVRKMMRNSTDVLSADVPPEYQLYLSIVFDH